MSKTTKITVKILPDTDGGSDSPRDWSPMGTMVCWHGRYTLGDVQPSQDPEEYQAELPEGTIMLPLYLYDHSGITMSTSGFSCPWDSGQVGFIYVTPETLVKEYGDDSEDSRSKATSVLQSEVKIYDCWLKNDIWGFEIAEAEVCECCESAGDPEVIDSCWSFYDVDGGDIVRDMKEHVEEKYHAALDEAWENRFD